MHPFPTPVTAPPLRPGRRRGASSAPTPGDADLQMALAVSASLRDEEERSRRLTEARLLELGLEHEVERARDRGEVVPPETERPGLVEVAG